MGQFDRLVRGARTGEDLPRKGFARSEGKVKPPKPRSLSSAPLRDESGGVGERLEEFGDEINKFIVAGAPEESRTGGDLSLTKRAKVRKFSE
jgi:hypothetical protein